MAHCVILHNFGFYSIIVIDRVYKLMIIEIIGKIGKQTLSTSDKLNAPGYKLAATYEVMHFT